MILPVAIDILVVVLAAWFWPHCARPALTAQRATLLAHRIVLGLTVLTIATYAFAAAARMAQIDGATLWWTTTIIGAIWILVVGLGYLQRYELILRVTGTSRTHSD